MIRTSATTFLANPDHNLDTACSKQYRKRGNSRVSAIVEAVTAAYRAGDLILDDARPVQTGIQIRWAFGYSQRAGS